MEQKPVPNVMAEDTFRLKMSEIPMEMNLAGYAGALVLLHVPAAAGKAPL